MTDAVTRTELAGHIIERRAGGISILTEAGGPIAQFLGEFTDKEVRLWLEGHQDGYTRGRSLGPLLRIDSIIPRYLREVAELPDRTSPEDWPEAMLITGDELDTLLRKFALEIVTGQPE